MKMHLPMSFARMIASFANSRCVPFLAGVSDDQMKEFWRKPGTVTRNGVAEPAAPPAWCNV
eukprot:4003570-Prymnesium_polylepis.1